jgi:hypothetical protein
MLDHLGRVCQRKTAVVQERRRWSIGKIVTV